MEIKSIPAFNKATSLENREVAGIFAVHGNLDSYRDISHPGSMSKTIAERMSRIKFLWNHDFYGGPLTAKIISIREVGADELPDKVRDLAPDATGGVEVVRRYLKNERAEQIFEAVAEGASDEMSYAYDTIRVETEMVDDEPPIRHLREIKLYEVSDVIFGANPATSGMKGAAEQSALSYLNWYLKMGHDIPHELIQMIPMNMLFDHLEGWMKSVKEGRRNANSDAARIDQIALLAYELGAGNVKLISEIEDEPTEVETPGEKTPETEQPDSEKSIEHEESPEIEPEDSEPNGEDQRREADAETDEKTAPPLTLSFARLDLLKLSIE